MASKKKNGVNGTHMMSSEFPQKAKVEGTIEIGEEAKSQVQALDGNLARAKMSLSDHDINVARIEEALAQAQAARQEARKAVLTAQQALSDVVMASAKDIGIDLKKGQWNFDTKTMTFSPRTAASA